MAYSMSKISYQNGNDKVSFYYHNYLHKFSYEEFYQDIVNYIIEERKLPVCKYNLYWIDAAGDKVEISSNDDLLIFRKLGVEPFHFFVTPLSKEKKSDAPLAGFLHKLVSCDGCNLKEIVGFRYKCLQCANYDLCENCESKHKHSEHLMLRMPNDEFRYELMAFKSGFLHLRGASGCRFLSSNKTQNTGTQHPENARFLMGPNMFENATSDDAAAPSPAARNTETGDSTTTKKKTEECHEKTKQRPLCPASGISKFIGMLNDLAEGGTVPTDSPQSNATGAQPNIEAAVNRLLNNAQMASVSSATAAATEASKFAEAAAKAATHAAESITSSILTNLNNNAALTINAEQKCTSAENNATSKILNNDNEGQTTSTVPNVATGLENLTQYIDPQYMKQGIQILNNFSDLFGKMLDSMESAGSSASASFIDSDPTNDTESPRESVPVKSNFNAANNIIASEKQTQEQAEIANTTKNVETATGSRAGSIDGDWQLVDGKVAQQQEQSISVPDLIEVTPGNSSNASITYPELSEQLQEDNNNHSNNNNNHNNNNHNNNNNNNNNHNNNNNNNNNDTIPIIYHNDERINSAVIKMMAMGFSNEGALLTQLLESVNGNIPEALDLMLLAQQSRSSN